MRRWLALLVFVVSITVVAATAGPAGAVRATSAPPKTCHSGYTRAVFPWGVRCIRSGQYCKKVQNPQYHKYGFQCVNGQLRKERGKRIGPKK